VDLCKIWKPEVFQGNMKKTNYFEGWYYKSISCDETNAYIIFPVLWLDKEPQKSTVFILFADMWNGKVFNFLYPPSQFRAAKDVFKISIGNSAFSLEQIKLDLNDGQNKVSACLKFTNIIPWPVTLCSPGTMGWYAFLPFLDFYHDVLSFDHKIDGYIKINGVEKDLSNGKGYIEKSWGKRFPPYWIWMQTNHFNETGVSLFGGVGRFREFGVGAYFTGFLIGFLYRNQLYRFTHYTGAKIKKLQVSAEKVNLIVSDNDYQLEIEAQRTTGVELPFPAPGGITGRVECFS
jgi:tocopherol cyclase